MSIYVDQLQRCDPRDPMKSRWKYSQYCHLWATGDAGIEELHEFAGRLKLKRTWFRSHIPHYDLTLRKRGEALAAGAISTDKSMFALFAFNCGVKTGVIILRNENTTPKAVA